MPFMYAAPSDPLAIWDVPVVDIVTVGSIGEALDEYTAARAAFLDASIAAIATSAFTAYSYGPTNLANATNFIPPADTIVFNAGIDADCNGQNDLTFFITPTDKVADAYFYNGSQICRGMSHTFICDGTSGFRQATGGAVDLSLLGVSIN